MEAATSCERLCESDKCLNGVEKRNRNRKPDLPIYVPRQMRGRLSAQDSCGCNLSQSPYRKEELQANSSAISEPSPLVVKNDYEINSMDQMVIEDSTSVNMTSISKIIQDGMNEVEKSQADRCDSREDPSFVEERLEAGVMSSADSNALLTSTSKDLILEDLSTDLAAKCILLKPTDSPNCVAKPTLSEAEAERSDNENETTRERERWSRNAVEVSGFPADFKESDIRKLVHHMIDRIVWINDTRCVCVFDDVETEEEASTLIFDLRLRVASDEQSVRVVPLAEADVTSKRKWSYVERYRRSNRFAADADNVPLRPRTTAVVANRMILRALGRTTDQHVNANED